MVARRSTSAEPYVSCTIARIVSVDVAVLVVMALVLL